MGKIYGGHLVARYLKEVEGVSTVFSIPGGHIDRIYDGFLEYGVKIIDVRHEQAAAMMAHSWSIFKAGPGVCLVTAGPGFTNSLTGVVNAFLDNVPMVVLSGTAPIRDWGRGALQEMNQSDMIKPVVKWSGMCHDIKRIPEYLSKAFRHAVSGRPGPVFLELPPDILNISIDEAEVVYPKKGSFRYKILADIDLIKEAAGLINEADRPLIIGGSGIGFSDCDKELATFVDTTGMPFILLNNGRGAIPDDHPLSLWDGGQAAMMTGMAQADLIVVLGIRFNWLLMFGEGFPQAKVIRIDIDATEIDRNRGSDIGLVGDMGSILKELNAEVEKRDRTSWVKALRDSYLPLIEGEIKERRTPKEPIHPARLVEQIKKAAGDDAIYIIDGGDTSYFGLIGLNAKEKSSVIAAAGGLFGCLGTGIPFGIAAKVARPEKLVIVINGDGSVGFNAMEFDTALRHNIPFVCVVVNDQAWGMIKHGQEIAYGNERVVGSELGVVHYEKVAEALGGYGEFVTKDEEIIPAIERAIESNKPACVNVLTDPTVTSPATLLFVDSLKMER
ncbi:MAG: thiamine pyrophosphate-binding protein [Thermodesulfobacteriota bacterium]|nr:thiamine pyrophosphate-binding protein [Thermodesulfobacteriota bacterium]